MDGTTEELSCSGVFLAIGHTPNTDFLVGKLELDDKGYVRWTTPQRTNTSVEGVFAAGDVADSYYRAGGHGRGHRLHGGAGRRALAGRAGMGVAVPTAGKAIRQRGRTLKPPPRA